MRPCRTPLVDVPVTPTQARHRALAARDAGLAGVVVSPSHLAAVGEPAGLTVASVVGYPSGRHHSLVKAAEARLAQSGRVLIRKSGTEPLIRVMAEAEDEAVLREVVDGIVAAVEKAAA